MTALEHRDRINEKAQGANPRARIECDGVVCPSWCDHHWQDDTDPTLYMHMSGDYAFTAEAFPGNTVTSGILTVAARGRPAE